LRSEYRTQWSDVGDVMSAIQGVEPGEQRALAGGRVRQQLDVFRVGFGMRPGADGAQGVVQNAESLGRESGHADSTDGCGGASENGAA
jgi:hypothetical protein